MSDFPPTRWTLWDGCPAGCLVWLEIPFGQRFERSMPRCQPERIAEPLDDRVTNLPPINSLQRGCEA
jgi:hypothetical protein